MTISAPAASLQGLPFDVDRVLRKTRARSCHPRVGVALIGQLARDLGLDAQLLWRPAWLRLFCLDGPQQGEPSHMLPSYVLHQERYCLQVAGQRLFLSGASSWAEDLVDFHEQVDLTSKPGELQRSAWAGGEKAISLPPAPPALLAQARALLAAKDPAATRTRPRSRVPAPVPDWTAMARGSAGALPALAQLVMPYPAGWSPGGPRGFWGRLATQVNELVDCPVEVVAHTVTQDIAIPPARGAGSPTHSRIVRCRHRLAAGHAQVVEPEHDDAGALAVETALDAGGLTQAGVSRVDFAHEGDCDSQAAQVASWLREQKLERALPAGGAIPVRKTRM